MGTSTVATLDRQELLSLLELRDPNGILSIYVDADPEQQASRPPPWHVVVSNELRNLRDRVKAEGPRERWSMLVARLEGLDDDLGAVLDATASGRGRALFAPLSDERAHRISLQVPLPTRVVLDGSAHLWPLVEALHVGRATGIAALSRSSVRVIDWRLGAAEELARFDFEEETGEWRRMKGPAAANPAFSQQTAPQRDRFERRLAQHREKFLETVAEQLESFVAARDWARIVVTGDASLRAPLLEELAPTPSREVVELEQQLEWASAHELVRAIAPELAGVDSRAQLAETLRVRDAALAGGSAALGLSDVLAALAEGRVARLLLDTSSDHHGQRAPDGRLAASGEVPAGADPGDLIPEPHLAERMVERALETDADVIPLDGEAAEALASNDGVAAALRW